MLEQTLEEWGQKLRKEGRREGRKEGLEEGQLKGMQKLLLEMLRDRFGPVPQSVRQRLGEVSSQDEMRRISRRILKARSLEDTGLA